MAEIDPLTALPALSKFRIRNELLRVESDRSLGLEERPCVHQTSP